MNVKRLLDRLIRGEPDDVPLMRESKLSKENDMKDLKLRLRILEKKVTTIQGDPR